MKVVISRAPGYWFQETSGVLKPVVRAYLAGSRLDSDQIGLMRRYLEQWFDASVWEAIGEDMTQLESIRQRVHRIATNEDIRAALKDALDLGIDPL
jgi:hypothetical protein